MVVDDCKPLAEEIFKKAIKKNYYTRMKFNCQLTSEQVKHLNFKTMGVIFSINLVAS